MPDVVLTPEGLTIDGRAALIQAGALHYARLPHPDLWRPILARMRMGGLNAVMIPCPWAYHSPAPGFYDFTGPRDLARLLDDVEQFGLWLIPHVGPWIGAGLDGGGIPPWLLRMPEAVPRCDGGTFEGDTSTAHILEPAPPPDELLRQVSTWWERLFPFFQGRDNLVLALLDPGCCAEQPLPASYAGALYKLARRTGLSKPAVPFALPRAVYHDLAAPAFDAPQDLLLPLVDVGGISHEAISLDAPDSAWPDTPAMIRVGLDLPPSWLAGRPMPLDKVLGPEHPRSRIAAAASRAGCILVLDPVHTGVNWGWTSTAGAGTLYGYGAPLTAGGDGDEADVAYYQGRRMAMTLETVGDVIARGDPAPGLRATPHHALFAARWGRAGTVAFLKGTGRDEAYVQLLLEQNVDPLAAEDIPLAPEAIRVLPLSWRLEEGRLLTTTMEPVLRTVVAGRELLILLNEVGGEILLPPDVRVRHRRGPVYIEPVDQGLVVHFDPARLGSLLVDRGGSPLQVLALEPALANRCWPLDDAWRTTPVRGAAWTPPPEEPARGVVIGPDFVLPQRDGGFRFLVAGKGFGYRWGPWRGSDPHTWLAPLIWQGPDRVTVPSLAWTSRPGAPEALPDNDDGTGVSSTSWHFVAPEGPFGMEHHGFYHGFVWYRTKFTGTATGLTLACRHACDVFLNGEHIATLNPPPNLGPVSPKTLPLPVRKMREENVLALLVENLGRDVTWDRAALDHGLTDCMLEGPEGPRPVAWRVRGGLSGEVQEQGFLGFADWDRVPEGVPPAGDCVTWHRATFKLALPRDHEVPLFLHLDRVASKAYVFLNGCLVGRMWYPQDGQRYFWLPDGILQRQGYNELLIAQWLRGAKPGIGEAQLVSGLVRRWVAEVGKA
jgi:hypothetical protein